MPNSWTWTYDFFHQGLSFFQIYLWDFTFSMVYFVFIPRVSNLRWILADKVVFGEEQAQIQLVYELCISVNAISICLTSQVSMGP